MHAETTSGVTGKWAGLAIVRRLRVIRQLRYLIAARAQEIAENVAAATARPVAEKLVSEVLPLVDACWWLEKNALRVLAPRYEGKKGRPLWLQGFYFEVHRQPFGAVLVIAPGNYPLFLPAVQVLHALVAGNGVLLKPAPGTGEVAAMFARLLASAGLDGGLLRVLPEGIEAVGEAVASGIDKVVFTGKSENGQNVLRLLASENIPAVMELSGEDAVVVFADADIDLVTRALRFGLEINGGNTCMAPRRIIVAEAIADRLLERMQSMGISMLPIERVRDEKAALEGVEASSFGLGVSIFTNDVEMARRLAARIRSGFVLINDLIVPTADPRLPFGGIKASGFGVTRGEEGLLEMTYPHVVGVRCGRFYPHFDPIDESQVDLFSAYIQVVHGRLRERLSALFRLLRTMKMQRQRKEKI